MSRICQTTRAEPHPSGFDPEPAAMHPARSLGLALTVLSTLMASAALAQPDFDCLAPATPAPAGWTVLGNGASGSVSTAALQAALDAGGAIRLDIGDATLIVDQTLRITRGTVLDVAGATLSGGATRRVLQVENPGNLTYSFELLNARVVDGRAGNESGGGLYKATGGPWQAVTIRIFDSRFVGNHAVQTAQDDGGGAIYAVGANELTLVRTRIQDNRGSNGGGIYSLGSRRVNLFDSAVVGNRATGTGGNPGNGGNGGGIGVDGAERHINLCRSRLIGNQANAYGGGLFTVAYDQQSFVRVQDSTIEDNHSTGTSNAHTGGVYLQGGPFLIAGSTFAGNTASGYGGLALFDHGGTAASGTIVNSTFSGNVALTGLGGAINMSATGGVTIQNSSLADNHAPCAVCFAGGIANAAGAALTLRNVLFQNNTGGNAFNPWTLLNAPVGGSHNLQWPQERPNSFGQQEAPVTPGALFAPVALEALAGNGGLTATRALPPGSAAIDAGTATNAPPLDQRGRPRFGAVDIGAYELQADAIFLDGFQ